jgi:hypothetical protein
VPGVLDEVRSFLGELRREMPGLFRPKPSPPPSLLSFEPVDAKTSLFHERAAYWSVRMGVTYAGVRVKDLRSLWGSCSRAGRLSFNRLLLRAPAEVLDYVVVHELAHRLEMNHSRRFWGHVERWCPEHKRHRRWLRTEGRDLLTSRLADGIL